MAEITILRCVARAHTWGHEVWAPSDALQARFMLCHLTLGSAGWASLPVAGHAFSLTKTVPWGQSCSPRQTHTLTASAGNHHDGQG